MIDLAPSLGTLAHMGKKLFNDSIEHAKYELDNLTIVVVDIKQLDSLLETGHHEWEQIFDDDLTGAFFYSLF